MHIIFPTDSPHLLPPVSPQFHPLCRVKGDAEMNQCSALNEPIVLQSLALPDSLHDLEGVR